VLSSRHRTEIFSKKEPCASAAALLQFFVNIEAANFPRCLPASLLPTVNMKRKKKHCTLDVGGIDGVATA